MGALREISVSIRRRQAVKGEGCCVEHVNVRFTVNRQAAVVSFDNGQIGRKNRGFSEIDPVRVQKKRQCFPQRHATTTMSC